jgi:hypothetical protein
MFEPGLKARYRPIEIPRREIVFVPPIKEENIAAYV